ncbi:hypothetical protein [Deinococcus sp. QL22]|uniref:hypothetical protein n=1 Tax=Deinococcus sp. QL22 TaxID=2939437 RepID=UPI0020181960|nr:hypothetical protein [Deinococcus sp. QL22]UQN10587.1 hypothetical protein M1R55_30785 [Deinococcus sp. QL22]
MTQPRRSVGKVYRSWTPPKSQTREALSGSCHKIRRTLNHAPAAQITTTAAPAPAHDHAVEASAVRRGDGNRRVLLDKGVRLQPEQIP